MKLFLTKEIKFLEVSREELSRQVSQKKFKTYKSSCKISLKLRKLNIKNSNKIQKGHAIHLWVLKLVIVKKIVKWQKTFPVFSSKYVTNLYVNPFSLFSIMPGSTDFSIWMEKGNCRTYTKKMTVYRKLAAYLTFPDM